MKFALHFGNNTFSDPEGARRLVRLAEAAGFDSVFAVEHVVFPDNYTSVYPYAPGGRLPGRPSAKLPDMLIWLTWVAAATTRLRFMTAAMILPQRNPLVLAKEVATLGYLSATPLSSRTNGRSFDFPSAFCRGRHRPTFDALRVRLSQIRRLGPRPCSERLVNAAKILEN